MRHFGRLPKTEDKRDYLLADHVSSLPPVPATFGHGNTYSDWKMLGNGPDPTAPGKAKEGAGDCVWASADHETMVALTDAGENPQTVSTLFSGKTAIADYSQFTGYDPKTGEGDNGTEIRESLKQRQKVGIVDTNGKRHKIGLYVSVDPHNLEHLLFAIRYFEALPIGCIVTESNEQAFGGGGTPIWDGSSEQPLGGHCIPLVGRPSAIHIAAVTWAKRILLTKPFFEQQVDEVWAYVTPERISKVTGKSYEGASEELLSEYLQRAAKL